MTLIRRSHRRFVLFFVTVTLLMTGCGDDEVSDNDSQSTEDRPQVEILDGPPSLSVETDATFEFECVDD